MLIKSQSGHNLIMLFHSMLNSVGKVEEQGGF